MLLGVVAEFDLNCPKLACARPSDTIDPDILPLIAVSATPRPSLPLPILLDAQRAIVEQEPRHDKPLELLPSRQLFHPQRSLGGWIRDRPPRALSPLEPHDRLATSIPRANPPVAATEKRNDFGWPCSRPKLWIQSSGTKWGNKRALSGPEQSSEIDMGRA